MIPLTILFEVLGASFPNYFSILLGLVFMLIVYGVPNGVAGLIERTKLKPLLLQTRRAA